MRRKLSTLHLLTLVAALLPLLAIVSACKENEDIDPAYTHYRYDIVTYMGGDNGGATYVYWGRDDSAAVTLRSSQAVDKLKPYQRVLLRYNYADDNDGASQRQVNVYGISTIVSDSVRYTTKPIDEYNRLAIKLRSVWRTGEYINLHCQAQYTEHPRHFYMIVDSTTWHNDTVDCYLIHDVHNDTTYYWTEAYASFNMGALWKRESCRAIRFYINDLTWPDTDHRLFIKP